MNYRLVLVVAFVACFAADHVRSQEPPVGKQKLDGLWRIVKTEDADKFEDLFLDTLIKFDGKTARLYKKAIHDNNLIEKFDISIDSTQKPKAIDLYGYLTGKKAVAPLRGIYAIEKDQLRLSWCRGPARIRPMGFALENRRQVSLTFKRIKSDKK